MENTIEMDLQELLDLYSLSIDDMDDLEIFCYCTGTCVALRCGVN